jgi:thiol-disulfide isomerase/thioredoxin
MFGFGTDNKKTSERNSSRPEKSLNKPVFVIVTADNCGACVEFKKVWQDVKKNIQNLNLVTIVEISLKTRADLPPPNLYPVDIRRFIGWFPTFLLFTSQSWDDALQNSSKQLSGVIFNGRVNSTTRRVELTETRIGPSSDNMIDWIRRSLNQLPFQDKPMIDPIKQENIRTDIIQDQKRLESKKLDGNKTDNKEKTRINPKLQPVENLGHNVCKLKFLPKNI